MSYLCDAISANLSECFIIMAKARVSTNPMYTGGAGGYSFYVRGGEQVVRQRRNNSNYGESASRTNAQMLRRVRWGNLVNVYKSMASWQPKAYEFKNPGQTDYNIFMSMNINSASCALTKDMANNGCAVQEGFWVSRGSLPPVERAVTDPSGGIGTNIKMSITPSASTTVAQFSADILSHNPLFQEGDNLAFILYTNYKDNRGYPYLSSRYSEVTLSNTSNVYLQSIPLMDRIIPGDNDDLAFRCGALNSGESGLVVIRTRRESGILKVSSQSIWGTGETLIDEFSGQEWIDECILSYGLDQQVPLDPGAGGDSRYEVVSTQTGNGADDGAVVLDVVNIGAGDFRMAVTPSSWSVDDISDTNALVFELALSPTAEFSASTERIIKRLTKADMLLGSGANPLDFSTTASMPYARYVLRADTGQSITCLIAKKVK